MPEQKFTTEEMTKIKGIQQKHLDIQLGFGQIHVARMQLEEQLEQLIDTEDQLTEELKKTRTHEAAFVEQINSKYGDGVLDQTSGTFTPNKEIPKDTPTSEDK